MKPYILGPLVFAAFCAVAQKDPDTSHTSLSRRIITRIDVLAGPSIIKPRSTESFNDILDKKIGFSGGVGLMHSFSSRFVLGVNVMYETKGYKYDLHSINEDYTPPADQRSIQNITFNYATASIIPRYALDKKKNFYLGLGPYFGYFFSENILIEIYINGSLTTKAGSKGNSPYTDYKKYDYGMTLMAGYDIPIRGRLGASIQFLYNLGLVNVALPHISEMRNSTFSLLVGLHLERRSSSF